MGFAYKELGRSPLRYKLSDFPVFFNSLQCLKTIESVLTEDGRIRNFPGVAEDERWAAKQRVGLFQDVRHEAQFYALEGQETLMLWMTQPSGWAWVDEDGFGFSGDARFCHRFDDMLQ